MGESVPIVVTGTTQTSAGRLICADLKTAGAKAE
jgi:uncharacterized protein YacL